MPASPKTDPKPPIDDQVLYITTQATQLGVRNNQYVVRDLDGSDTDEADSGSSTLGTYPVKKIETINVFGRGVDVTSGAIATAATHDTAINFFTTNGRSKGQFRAQETSVAVLHEQQHTLNDTDRLSISKRLVLGKVINARRYLERKDIDIRLIHRLQQLLIASKPQPRSTNFAVSKAMQRSSTLLCTMKRY